MIIEEFSSIQLQQMRSKIKKLEILAKYFEGEEKGNLYYLQNTTSPPTSYVKSLDVQDLISFIVKNTYKGAAEKLGVSTAFLKVYVESLNLDGVRIKVKDTELDGFRKYSAEEVLEVVKKVEYISLVSAITGWSETALRKYLGRKGINTNSEHTTSRGRRAELFYKKVRGSFIERDLNEEDPHSPYDFDDEEYGKVNVRSAKPYVTKDGKKRWYFKTKGSVEEAFAFIGYDVIGDRVEFVLIGISDNFGGKGYIVEDWKSNLQHSVKLLYPIINTKGEE